MHYTKPMVDLVYEIRRRVSPALKPGVKMANPELLKDLANYYRTASDTITKTLIKELLSLAGDEWKALLQPRSAASAYDVPAAPPRQVVKIYRGQVVLEDAPHAARSPAESTKPVRMYRGHPVI